MQITNRGRVLPCVINDMSPAADSSLSAAAGKDMAVAVELLFSPQRWFKLFSAAECVGQLSCWLQLIAPLLHQRPRKFITYFNAFYEDENVDNSWVCTPQSVLVLLGLRS